ncbi:DUF4831 family protein [Bacteroidales bacterium OttesenSCG-928-C19]|nr:DUF4831 family protein [Bacteroidales bacterium OttesenSCG-928-C19]
MKQYKFVLIVFAFLFLSSCSTGYKVHSVSQKQRKPIKNGFSYALPQTVLQIDLLVERIEDLRGPYIDYANALLGISDVIEDDDVTYKLSDIRFSTYSEPDPKAYYYVEAKSNFPSIKVLPNGIIQSVNVDEFIKSNEKSSRNEVANKKKTDEKLFLEPIGSLNFSENTDYTDEDEDDEDDSETTYQESFTTVTVGKSVEEKAKAAAKQLLQVRMKKQELIYGEYEDSYSKNAIDYIYNQLDKMEKDLLALFVGKTISTLETKSFYIVPDKLLLVGDEQPLLLCGFSPERGVTELEKEDGVIIHATIRCEQDLHVLNDFLRKKNNVYKSGKNNKKDVLVRRKKNKSRGFVYRVPDNALVTVKYGAKTYSEKLVVNQYGTLVRLPEKNLSIKYDTETGNILYVEPAKKNK